MHPAFKIAVSAIPCSILLIFPAYSDPINLPKLLVLIPITLTALLLTFLLRNSVQKTPLFFKHRLFLFVYSLLGAIMLVVGVVGNQNYVRALFGASGRNNGLIFYISMILLAIIILRLPINQLSLLYLEKVLTWTSLVFMAYCLIQFFELDPVSWSNPYSRVIGTLGNPNFSASALSIFSAFWLFKFVNARATQPERRILLLIPTIIMIFLSLATQSLQGIIVFLFAAILIIFMALREKSTSKWGPLAFISGTGLIFALLFASFLGFGPFGDFLEQYTLKLRGWYAFFGLEAMLASPWRGFGVDNYISVFRTFKSKEFVSQYGYELSTNNAHSIPIQIGATFGLIVFILYCLVQFMILLKAIKIMSSENSQESTIKGVSLTWILTFSQSLLSIEIIGLGVMNWILGAVILSFHKKEGVRVAENYKVAKNNLKFKGFPIWTSPVTIASLCCGAFSVIPLSIEDKAFQNLESVRGNSENARVFAKENFNNLSSITLYYPEKLDRIIPSMYEVGMLEEIEKAVINLYRVEPNNAQALDLLATYYNITNQFTLEVETRENLRDLDPWNVKLEMALAYAYSEIGDKKGLQSSLSRLKSLNASSTELADVSALLEGFPTSP